MYECDVFWRIFFLLLNPTLPLEIKRLKRPVKITMQHTLFFLLCSRNHIRHTYRAFVCLLKGNPFCRFGDDLHIQLVRKDCRQQMFVCPFLTFMMLPPVNRGKSLLSAVVSTSGESGSLLGNNLSHSIFLNCSSGGENSNTKFILL